VLAGCDHLNEDQKKQLGSQLFRLHWLGGTGEDVDMVLARLAQRERGENKLEQAVEWLKGFLSVHAYPSEEIFAAGQALGFGKDYLCKAKQKLGKEAIQASNNPRFSATGKCWWGPGNPADWKLRPVVSSPTSGDTANNKQPNNSTVKSDEGPFAS
jgi:hypothetical protein